jgi:hypothetical protein
MTIDEAITVDVLFDRCRWWRQPRYHSRMTAPDPAERADVSYENATPEQLAEAREAARRKLAEADARRTPGRRQRLLELLGLDQPAR